MLIIIVKRFFDILKMLCPEHPGITDGVILIKNVLRETIGVIQNDMTPIEVEFDKHKKDICEAMVDNVQNEGDKG